MSDQSQYERYKKAIARIYRADGAVVGSGFLVSERYVLTCAHVVADALGIEHTNQGCPQGWVELDFPIPAAQYKPKIKDKPKIKAKVVFWRAISPCGKWEYGDDIAGLEFEEELADEISPVGLVTAGDPTNIFHALGFPIGYDDGVWTYGEFRGEQGTGWVQIVVTGTSDYFVEGGFSGAPVWDDTSKAVAGIIVSAEPASQEQRTKVKAAFMIPTKVLINSWDYLQSKISQHNQEVTDFKPDEVAQLLTGLNYTIEKAHFEKLKDDLKPGTAFLVSAIDKRTQSWLVSVLARQLPDYNKSEKISINVSYRNRSDIVIWKEVGKKFDIAETEETVIQELAKYCQTKSVIIAVYNFDELDEIQKQNLYNFWFSLLEKVKQLSYDDRKNLILFLADKGIKEYPIQEPFFKVMKSEKIINKDRKTQSYTYLIALNPLNKLHINDVKGWLNSNPVRNFLGENQVDFIHKECICNWPEKEEPLERLDRVCTEVFRLEDRTTEIERYWKLL